MVTFHEIKRVIQKLAVLSSYIGQLGQLLPQVIQLTEQIGSINEDLTLERDRITAKMRSVEILGEILKTQVYHNPTVMPASGVADLMNDTQAGPVQAAPLEGGSSESKSPQEMAKGHDQSGYFPGINSGSLLI